MINKDCKNCKHAANRWLKEPCKDCVYGDYFENKTGTTEEQTEGSCKDEE